MKCYICGELESLEILRKDPVRIWTDTSDDESIGKEYECILRQCKHCGHVYQPINDRLRSALTEIYLSEHAQGPSSMGIGQYGLQRANSHFLEAIDLTKYKSAIEIGCGNGYLLRHLKEIGYEKLIGIEPSVNIAKDIDGIRFENSFFGEHLKFDEQVDLIFSIAVFEHIENINKVLMFCRNSLTINGELFFAVPNAQKQLETGDPALFIHQHVHYFTENSLNYLLRYNGFHVISIKSNDEGLHVRATPCTHPVEKPKKIIWYRKYQENLDQKRVNLTKLTQVGDILVHGACNSLNNIASCIENNFDLTDNDENKQGKSYFGKTVIAPNDLNLSKYSTILIVPSAFYSEISAHYLRRQFTGNIIGV